MDDVESKCLMSVLLWFRLRTLNFHKIQRQRREGDLYSSRIKKKPVSRRLWKANFTPLVEARLEHTAISEPLIQTLFHTSVFKVITQVKYDFCDISVRN